MMSYIYFSKRLPERLLRIFSKGVLSEFFRHIKFMFLSFAVVILTSIISALQPVYADIDIEVDRRFVLDEQSNMAVIELETITNNFTDRFIPGGTTRQEVFTILAQDPVEKQKIADNIYDSLQLRINNRVIEYEKTFEDELFGIRYVVSNRLEPSQSQTISLRYSHPELSERVGGLVDAYIPSFPIDFQFVQGSLNYNYRTRLFVPQNLGAENIVSVEPISQYSEDGFDVYEFSQQDLVGNYVWVQRGDRQIYSFELIQQIPASTEINTGDLVQYSLIVPRDISEVNIEQKVYFSEFSPEPAYFLRDEWDNLVAVYNLLSHQDYNISITGYAELTRLSRRDLSKGGSLDIASSSLDNFSAYIAPAQYWEVNNIQIEQTAENIMIENNLTDSSDNHTVYEYVSSIYDNVVSSIDYSQVKRFGLNERQGALKTLEGGSAVCMEYSDLFLTLARNRGVATRAAFGYGYDSRLGTEAQEPHQWVQVYFPSFKSWSTVDVTWGESGTQVLGGDLNHFFTHVAVTDPNTPSSLSRFSLVKLPSEMTTPEYKIDVLAEVPVSSDTDLRDISQLANNFNIYDLSELDRLETIFYWDAIRLKYIASWRLLLTNPAMMDISSIILLTSTIGIVLVFITLVRILFSVSRKYSVSNG